MMFFILSLLSFSLQVLLVSSAGNKPPEMAQGIYCECCSAIVKELSTQLEKKTSDPHEVKVIEAIEGICDVKHFRANDYSPPTTMKACKYLTEHYDEDIETILIKKDPEPEKKICYELTKACEGVDRTKKQKEDMDVRINDQKQEVNKPDDGINRMNVDINDPNAAKNLADQIKQQMAMGGGGGGDDVDDDEDDADDGPDADDDGEEGNERSVKKPKDTVEASKEKTEL